MPKCGGTSFKELLKKHYKLRFSKDYDYPIHWTPEQRKKETEKARKRIQKAHTHFYQYRFSKCIHGHFLPYKYDHFYGKNGNLFITWLRDPIERLVSHYNFWIRTHEEHKQMPLLKKVIEEEWTLEEFAFSEELRNIYSKFLWNFPIERFDFIGITEYYEQDLNYFANHYLEIDDVAVPKKNISPRNSKTHFKDKSLIKELKSFHARDYELYNYALQKRQRRIQE